jgi:hypothetical protein
MDTTSPLHSQIFQLLRQYSHAVDRRHLNVLIQADVHPYPIEVGKLAPPVNEATRHYSMRFQLEEQSSISSIKFYFPVFGWLSVSPILPNFS